MLAFSYALGLTTPRPRVESRFSSSGCSLLKKRQELFLFHPLDVYPLSVLPEQEPQSGQFHSQWV